MSDAPKKKLSALTPDGPACEICGRPVLPGQKIFTRYRDKDIVFLAHKQCHEREPELVTSAPGAGKTLVFVKYLQR